MSQLAVLNTPINRRRLLVFSAAGALALSPVVRRAAFAAVDSSVTTTDLGTFFDPAVIHELALEFDQDDFEAMVTTFKEQDKKEWIEATVTIDGKTYEKSGIRLKGNSSLGFVGTESAAELPNDAPPMASPEASGPMLTTDGEGGGGVDFDIPQELPWLVRLDKYVKKQAHDGVTEFAIRSNMNGYLLNEVVSLDLLAEAGLASQRAAYGSLTVNGSDPVLRLTVETPGDAWMAVHFSADGLLFKSDADGDWSYNGDDPTAYTGSFDLEAGGTGDDAVDYESIVEWLDFVNNSDDAAFQADLATRLDLPAFTTYLAMMDLLQNDDDISGPGNNSYLYFAPDTGQVTVVPWDMNLSFAMALAAGRTMRGGGAGPVFTTEPGGAGPSGTPVVIINGEVVSGTPQAGMMPGGEGGPAGRMGGFNPLVTRFDEVDEFTAQVESATAEWKEKLFTSGRAEALLDTWVTLLQNNAGTLVDAANLDEQAEAMRTTIKES
jgi:spore coat protein CotH